MVWGYCISEDVSWGWQVIQPPSRGRYLPRTGMGASKALTWVPLEKVVLWRSSKCASVTAIISARTLNWSNVTARGRSRYNSSVKVHHSGRCMYAKWWNEWSKLVLSFSIRPSSSLFWTVGAWAQTCRTQAASDWDSNISNLRRSTGCTQILLWERWNSAMRGITLRLSGGTRERLVSCVSCFYL